MKTVELLAINNGAGLHFIQQSRIVYCLAEGNYTLVQLSSGKVLTCARTLKEVEAILPDLDFVRIHHSYIVNLDHIRHIKVGSDVLVLLSNGKELTVSRRRKKMVMQKFISL